MSAVLAAVLAPVDQHYLLEAREMQALSFAAHIPWSPSGSRSLRWC
jgi:hypothetical protein